MSSPSKPRKSSHEPGHHPHPRKPKPRPKPHHKRQQGHRKGHRESRDFFEPWLDPSELSAGIESGRFYSGMLRISSKNRQIAFVTCKGVRRDVFIDGEKRRNRALNGDIVVVEIFPQSEWNPTDRVIHDKKEEFDHGDHRHDLAREMERLDVGGSKEKDALWQPAVDEEEVAQWTYRRAREDGDEDVDEKKSAVLDVPGLQPVGKVVGLVAANEDAAMSEERMEARAHTGILFPQHGFDRKQHRLRKGYPLPAGDHFAEFRPMDKRVPFMLIPRSDLPQSFIEDPLSYAPPDQRLFAVSLGRWDHRFRFPRGRIISQIGEAGEIGPETEALLVENDCDHGEFPEAVLDEMRGYLDDNESGSWKIPEEEIKARRDLRHLRIVSIDPATAKDLDDALHCTYIPKSKTLPEHYEIGVHIADVTHFVRPGTEVDREARRRATTVYLVHKVIPMLPPILSEELCSLNPGVERLAYSCIWKMTADGEMLPNTSTWYGRTVIRSCAKLDYGLAQQMIDGVVTHKDATPGSTKWPELRQPIAPHAAADVVKDVRMLAKIGLSRRAKRYDPKHGGGCMMKSVKLSFTLDHNGNPSGMRSYPIHDSNRLIEEYMLLANYLVAQQLLKVAKSKAFVRHHPPPDRNGMQDVAKDLVLAGLGHAVSGSSLLSAAELHSTLERIRETESEEMYLLLNLMLQLPMKQAKYFVATDSKKSEWRHWALNMPYYTHFTSPIRRYADVCVHRILTATLACAHGKAFEYEETEEELEEKAEHCNTKKEASKLCQDTCDKVFFCIYVRRKFKEGNPLQCTGLVRSLGQASFTIFLPDFGVDTLVHARNDWKASNVTVVMAESGEVQSGGQDRKQDKKRRGQRSKNNKMKDKEKVVGLKLEFEGGKVPGLSLKIATRVKVELKPAIQTNGRIDFATSYIGGQVERIKR